MLQVVIGCVHTGVMNKMMKNVIDKQLEIGFLTLMGCLVVTFGFAVLVAVSTVAAGLLYVGLNVYTAVGAVKK